MEIVEKEGYIVVAEIGTVRSLTPFIEGTKLMIMAANKYQVQHIIVDNRQLSYSVSMGDAFNIVRYYEKKMPELREIVTISVVNDEDYDLAMFWETICNKKGFMNKVFLDMEEAEKWTQKEIKERKLSN